MNITTKEVFYEREKQVRDWRIYGEGRAFYSDLVLLCGSIACKVAVADFPTYSTPRIGSLS